MERIDIVSVKGGVGKSFIAYFLTKLLATNLRTLLIDKDLTSTISRVYNIRGNLLSYLTMDQSYPSYFKEVDSKLTVVNLGCSRKIKNVEPRKIAEIYNGFSDYDLMIVDNPPIPSDVCLDTELQAYYTYLREKRLNYNMILILPPNQILLDESLAFIELFKDYVNNELSILLGTDLVNFDVISSVINMYNPRERIDISKVENLTDKIVKIPFKKEAIYTPLNQLSMPKEIEELAKYVLEYLENN
ncbi:ParA family protein [Sulfolobus sp. E5-1-F]|uniref:ParA family protein n=1 Tax=Sulfolobaceae TaxID=118883 RepID=UPI001297CAA4|nr:MULTISPECIES: ParA family protein [unclassified Sulfolobus]QGA53611.1 ParA family protein [Sulfolobus sp. E5-1-F]QGA68727.1 ParA family protein [Sulfolobus sp. E11-6]